MSPAVERLVELRRHLKHLEALRNVLIHDYVTLDLDRAVAALDQLAPVAAFAEIVRQIEAAS